MIKYIKNEEHLERVLHHMKDVKTSLCIATADLRDLYVKGPSNKTPFLSELDKLVKRGVFIRILCSSPTSQFYAELENYPSLNDTKYFRVKQCFRNHMKLVVFDQKEVYMGSANMTPAALGERSVDKRNFEAGIFSDEKFLVENVVAHFKEAWAYKTSCKECHKDKKIKCSAWQEILKNKSIEDREKYLDLSFLTTNVTEIIKNVSKKNGSSIEKQQQTLLTRCAQIQNNHQYKNYKWQKLAMLIAILSSFDTNLSLNAKSILSIDQAYVQAAKNIYIWDFQLPKSDIRLDVLEEPFFENITINAVYGFRFLPDFSTLLDNPEERSIFIQKLKRQTLKEIYPNYGTRWTKSEEKVLHDYFDYQHAEASAADFAKRFGRTTWAVKGKLEELGIYQFEQL